MTLFNRSGTDNEWYPTRQTCMCAYALTLTEEQKLMSQASTNVGIDDRTEELIGFMVYGLRA